MPAYDYKCPTCDDVFEVNRAFGVTRSVRCPKCDVDAKRIYSPVGIHFKGTGFHNTDYRAKKVIPVPAEATSSDRTESTTKTEKPAACGGESSPACASCPAAE